MVIVIMFPECCVVDFRAVNFVCCILNDRQSALDCVKTEPVYDPDHTVHGGEQSQPRLLDDVENNIGALIDKPHIDDYIKTKVHFLVKKIGTVNSDGRHVR